MGNFETFVLTIEDKLKTLQPESIKRKSINYGEQLTLLRKGEKVVLSIYNGKKGHKYVWGGVECPLQQEAQKAVADLLAEAGGKLPGNNSPLTLLQGVPGFDYLWAGSDESGKGDFFGPLVVAAVLVNKDIAQKLANFGVRDSKELSDKKIAALASKIEACAPLHRVLALPPEMYNYRYEQMQAANLNLNDLLAKGHIKVLSSVLQDNPHCHFALVDRFTLHNNISKELEKEFPDLTVVQQPKAEADMAVAAASILARAKFVEIMKELSLLAKRELPKGGGQAATECAREIAQTEGNGLLDKLVKKHFANYKVIRGK